MAIRGGMGVGVRVGVALGSGVGEGVGVFVGEEVTVGTGLGVYVEVGVAVLVGNGVGRAVGRPSKRGWQPAAINKTDTSKAMLMRCSLEQERRTVTTAQAVLVISADPYPTTELVSCVTAAEVR